MLTNRYRISGAISVAVALPLALVSIPTAVADPNQDPESTVAIVERAVQLAEGPQTARSYSTEQSDASSGISLPSQVDPSATIRTEDTGTMSIAPPSGATSHHEAAALTTADSTVVTQQVDENTIRHSAVLDEHSSNKQEYVLTSDEDFKLELTDSGSIDIVHPSDSGRLVTGQIAAPWAIDADGKSLPTEYDIEGSKVTQVVDTSNAAFPVVADPKLTYGQGVYLNLTGFEMNAVSLAASSLFAGGAFIGCAIQNPPVPPIVKPIIKVVCNLGGTAAAAAIFREISKNPMRYNNQQCYQRQYPDLRSRGFVGVGRENCNW